MKDFDLRKYLAEGKLLKEEIDVNKILSDGGYDIIDDEELLMTVKSRLKGKNNIDAEKLNLLVMKIEDEEGGNIDFTENKLVKELSPEEKAMEIEKAKVGKIIEAFDDENYDYRYKFYDVRDHEGEIFVIYNTQADYEQIRGKEMLLDLLSNFQFRVYVHYTVRDYYRSNNHDIYSKKGYELA